MANSSDWMAASPPARPSPMPAWIAALQQSESQQLARSGFSDCSPFTPQPRKADPAPPPSDASPPRDTPTPEELAYRRGLAEGRAAAQADAEAALAVERARCSQLRTTFQQLDKAAMDALAQELSATVQSLCSGVLGEYAADPDQLMERCEAAARRLGSGAAGLTLHLHPQTRAQIDEAAFQGWSLAEDPTLEPGALRLANDQGAVRDCPQDWSRAIAQALGG